MTLGPFHKLSHSVRIVFSVYFLWYKKKGDLFMKIVVDCSLAEEFGLSGREIYPGKNNPPVI